MHICIKNYLQSPNLWNVGHIYEEDIEHFEWRQTTNLQEINRLFLKNIKKKRNGWWRIQRNIVKVFKILTDNFTFFHSKRYTKKLKYCLKVHLIRIIFEKYNGTEK